MCRKSNIVKTTKVRRQEWAGHPVRMSDKRTPAGRKKKAGRPKLG
jgi:hypothetical protein